MKGFPILRVLGILLGGVSLVLLSRPALGLHFKDVFESLLDVLGDSLSRLLMPIEYWVVVPVIDWLRSLRLDIPHPAKYWHQSFVLLWLLLGSWARNFSDIEDLGNFVFTFLWAGLTALAAGVMSGTVPLNSLANVLWPITGLAAFATGRTAWHAARGLAPISLPLTYAAATMLAAFWGYAATTPITSTYGIGVPSPGLLGLAVFVSIMAVSLCLVGLQLAARGLSFPNNSGLNVGIDILGAFGVAAIMAFIGFTVPG